MAKYDPNNALVLSDEEVVSVTIGINVGQHLGNAFPPGGMLKPPG